MMLHQDSLGGRSIKIYKKDTLMLEEFQPVLDSTNRNRFWKLKRRLKMALMALFHKNAAIYTIRNKTCYCHYINYDAKQQLAVLPLFQKMNLQDIKYNDLIDVERIDRLN
ncbi:MAG: hypothetical protein ACI8ZM_002481 [Crocinitomix sp.]|jgi:hypothetical protein